MVLSVQDFAGGIVPDFDPASQILKGLNAREQIQNKPLRQQALQQNIALNEQNQQLNQIKLQQAQQQQAKAQQQQALRQQMTVQLEANARIRPVFKQILNESDPVRQNAQLSQLHSDLVARGEEEAANEIAPWLNITDPDVLKSTLQGGVNQIDLDSDFAESVGRLPKGAGGRRAGGKGGAKFSARSEIIPGGGTVGIDDQGNAFANDAAGEPVFGQARLDMLSKSRDIEVQEAGKKQSAKSTASLRAQRTSAIRAEFSERARTSARQEAPLRAALQLASSAQQGALGQAALFVSRFFPNFDASKEGALDAALKSLAMEQLQQFKGPTTDFEFRITQDVAGNLGDGRSANIARLKSLDRNRWFNQREVRQFNKWKGDPDQFVFNFDEQIQTKLRKAPYTLRDLQDTAVKKNMTIDEVLRELNK